MEQRVASALAILKGLRGLAANGIGGCCQKYLRSAPRFFSPPSYPRVLCDRYILALARAVMCRAPQPSHSRPRGTCYSVPGLPPKMVFDRLASEKIAIYVSSPKFMGFAVYIWGAGIDVRGLMCGRSVAIGRGWAGLGMAGAGDGLSGWLADSWLGMAGDGWGR